MRIGLISAGILLLTACQGQEEAANAPAANAEASSPTADAGNDAAQSANSAESASHVAGACMMQGDEPLNVKPLRATGTEPFWGARIEGRCVTYSHPEDLAGTRLWTRYVKGPDGESWSGAYGERPFELRVRAAPGCSDGMSDKKYPLAVSLTVQGEERKGCAEPI